MEAERVEARVWFCDGCGSWTDRALTREQLLAEWGWIEWREAEDDVGLFCSECQ